MEGYPNTSGYIPDLVPQSANEINDDTGILPALPNQPMDEEEFRSRVRRAIEDTATYIDSYIAPSSLVP